MNHRLLCIPALYFIGAINELSDLVYLSALHNLAVTGVSIVVFFAINFKRFVNRGQTIGKQLLGIRIASYGPWELSFVAQLVPRHLFYVVIVMVPSVGGMLALLNVLFIFGRERRCMHDLFAKTKVVQV